MATSPWMQIGKILQETIKANVGKKDKSSPKKQNVKTASEALDVSNPSMSPAFDNKFLQVLPSSKEAQKIKEDLKKKELLERIKRLKSLPQPKTKKEVYNLRSTVEEDIVNQAGNMFGGAGDLANAGFDLLGKGYNKVVSGEIFTDAQKGYKDTESYFREKGLSGAAGDALLGTKNATLGAFSQAVPALANTAKFGFDTLATGTDLIVPSVGKDFARAKIKRMEAEGKEVPKELYQLANQRSGDVFRYGGAIAESLGKTGGSHGDDLSEAMGADTESASYAGGKMATEIAGALLLTKKLNVNTLPKLLSKGEKIKQGINLGKKIMGSKTGIIRNSIKSLLDKASNNIPEYAKLFNNSALNTAAYDAVSKGETNAGSLMIGFLGDKFLQKASSKFGNLAKKQYAKSLPDMIPEQKGLATTLSKQYNDVVEHGIKKGWSGADVDSFAADLRKEGEVALNKADEILSKNNPIIKEDEIVTELLEKTEDMVSSGLVTDADKILKLYDKRIAPLVKNRTFDAKALKKLKQGLNKLLKPVADPSVVGPRQAEEIQYALAMKQIIDSKLNNILGDAWAAFNKDAFVANQLSDIADLKKIKINNDMINDLTRETKDTSYKSGRAMLSQQTSDILSSNPTRQLVKKGENSLIAPFRNNNETNDNMIEDVNDFKAYIQTLSPEEKEVLKQSMLKQAQTNQQFITQ